MRPSIHPRGGVLRQARQHLLDDGLVPQGLIAEHLIRSWLRSRQAGLAPTGRIEAPCYSPQQLRPVLELHRELVNHARPMMEHLHAQVRDSGFLVLLADARGVVLESLGDPGFARRADRVSLMPGASWHETHRGTNAIGTALAECAPMEIHGAEHFLERNAFLTCAAAPIQGPEGRLLGVLDISGDQRNHHPHTRGLVCTAAQMIENRLLCSRYRQGIRLHFHATPEGVGTLAEGIVALSEDGWLIGANRAAFRLLKLAPADLGSTPLQRVFDVRLGDLLDWGRRWPHQFMPVATVGGARLYLQVFAETAELSVTVAAKSPVGDELASLDTGDAAMATAIVRARRVLDKPIPILLAGESGVGKELFAQAMHASGLRREQPFVPVNCAALPEHLVESELFGYAPGAFTGARREGYGGRIREAHGGTLFLDEIGDMPLAIQARLLRVLQERQVTPLGGRAQNVDFQLVCATHRDLREEVAAGRFREDLYYRINGLTLVMPPLRERQDFPALVRKVLDEVGGGRHYFLDADVAFAFAAYRWPGNLRQLSNVLRTAVALTEAESGRLAWFCLPDDIVEELRRPAPNLLAVPAAQPGCGLRAQSDALLQSAVAAAGGNISEAARRLGVSRNTLYRRLGTAARSGCSGHH
jgi:sigma-54 dependent transcriptional regulator, acetoin dehydrogenase operon transcriptional activator AcoR